MLARLFSFGPGRWFFHILFDSGGNWRPPESLWSGAGILSLNNKNLSTLEAVWARDRKVLSREDGKLASKTVRLAAA